MPPEVAPRTSGTFAETALRLSGKEEDEVRRTGAIDQADDQVETLYSPQYQTVNSPIHRAVWEKGVPRELFESAPASVSPETERVMSESLAIVSRHLQASSLHDEHKKLRESVLEELAAAGYWGLLVDKAYGGSGAPFTRFAAFLSKMAQLDPTVAGLASVHGCIGAVDPLETFGNREQKARYLPKLASGERLSAFALTEPCAGSDLTALRTTARREGDVYLVNGEKLFITNATFNRTIGLVCLIDNKPAVLIADLPAQENDTFRFKPYGLYALKHTYNQGMIFRDFPVPAENRLNPGEGDGLTIAYHGLNRGRVALCANAAGVMRVMLANMLPWAKFRKTYGQPIMTRELVERRVGHLAGLIVACDALTQWCANLLDKGYRGEMECTIAKIFGSEAQKEAAIDLFMKTHGGRSFLHGHLFGDNVHEFLAPCIYEGEGEMLGMAFFKSLVKQHGRQFFEPIGLALAAKKIKTPNLMNPAHVWALKNPLWNYGKWYAARSLQRPRHSFADLPDELRGHAEFAADWLQRSSLLISGVMRKYQLKLADRQCRMADVSGRIQLACVILVTALHAAKQADEIVRASAATICTELRRRMMGGLPSDHYYKSVTRLGAAIAEKGFPQLADAPQAPVLMPYEP
jgi:alkylation response protein AidB-like acyl-CoA dehydrogenase